jgi:alpha-glucosidase (family GH31 glycosyl hydrolase)
MRPIRRTRHLAALSLGLLAGAAAVAACDQAGSSQAPPSSGPTLTVPGEDGGPAVTVAYDPKGSLTIASGPKTVISSPTGAPLLTRTPDASNPDGWHDPTKPQTGLTPVAIDPRGVSFAADDDAYGVATVHMTVAAQPSDTALLTLSLAADGSFLTGLGEQLTHVSATGRVTPMFLDLSGATESGTNDAHVPVPFLVSSAGWGIFVASREAGAFDVGVTDPKTIAITFEGRSLDVYFFVDPDPVAIVARFNRLAGLPRFLPRWVLSPIHWRHWSSFDDVLDIAREYRQRHIPSSAMWFDDGWQTGFNTFAMSSSLFTDVAGMMGELEALGFHSMAWSTPYLEQPTGPGGKPTDDAQQLYELAAANRWLVEDGKGNVYTSPATPIKMGAGIVDYTSPGAQQLWEFLVGRATSVGLRGFKCDYGEELIPNLVNDRNPVEMSDGTTARTARIYPIEEHTTYRTGLDRDWSGDDMLIVRASAYGGASATDVIWPGDLDSSFAHRGDPMSNGSNAVGGLPAAVVDLQTLSVSGFPAFGSDTAGYRGSPTPETELRWMEHTALTPVMQVYEDGDDRLPWAISDAAGAEYQAMASLHQQLVPYHAVLMTAAQLVGTPPVRPLPLAYPDDAAGFARADDEYLLGSDLLVAPVVEPSVTSRAVHLPPGKWVSWWSDQVMTGPADIMAPAPLGQPPFYARAGGLVPMLPPGVDTLVGATEPGVVTLASIGPEMTARAWASGSSTVTVDGGSRIDVVDTSTGVTITWTPGSTIGNLTLDMDTRVRTGSSTPVSTLSALSGGPYAHVSSTAQVSSSSSGAWFTSNGHAYVRFVGAGSVSLR